jgi:hypothetical protein
MYLLYENGLYELCSPVNRIKLLKCCLNLENDARISSSKGLSPPARVVIILFSPPARVMGRW